MRGAILRQSAGGDANTARESPLAGSTVPMRLRHAALEGFAGDLIHVSAARASRYLRSGTATAEGWNAEQLEAVAAADAERQSAVAARLRADGLMPGGSGRRPPTTFPWED